MLSICSNGFGKLVFDAIFEFILEYNLLSSIQANVYPNNSSVKRHCNSTTLSILHAFDTNPSELCGVFLHFIAQKVKLLIKNLFSKRDLTRRKLWISLYSANRKLS